MPSPDITEDTIESITHLLKEKGVRLVACTFVDNAGVTRVKGVPLVHLASAVRKGVGISYTFAVFGVNDHITKSPGYDTPSGDMRLVPDLSSVAVSGTDLGWAWAPVDQMDQEGEPMPVCQRGFLKNQIRAAKNKGLAFKMTYEVEFTLLDQDGMPVSDAPGYSPRKLLPVKDFILDLLEAAKVEGIDVVQIHPEYALGQYELSVAPTPPLQAADKYVLLRQIICRVADIHGFTAAFAPTVIPGEVGNGCHLHFSIYENGQNLFTGGSGPEGLTEKGEAAAAGVLHRLPEMMPILASSIISYDRLQPSHWSGAFTCWGLENREASLRLIKGMKESRGQSTNFELKCIDGTANPYLTAGAVMAAALDGMENRGTLPPPTCLDPAVIPQAEREKAGIFRLPQTLEQAVDQMEKSDFLIQSMGKPLFDAFIATRRFDWDTYKDKSLEETVGELRFRFG